VKKQELKKIIKPIVQECINEVLLSEGLLASVISEVVSGLTSTQQLLADHPVDSPTTSAAQEATKLKETRERMLDAIGRDAYKGVNVFEGTTPMVQSATAGPAAAASNPLSNVDPRDPGVDISRVFGSMSSKWGKIAKGDR
jgi:hypothetical protein